MCRAARFLTAVLAFCCAGGPLVAQGAESSRIRAQERLVDSLALRHRAALVALKSYDDSVTRASMRLDSVMIGKLRVLIDPAIRDRAEAAARIASSRIDSLAGSAAARLASHWIVIRAHTSDTLSDTVVVAVREAPSSRQVLASESHALWGTPHDSVLAHWVYQASTRVLSMSPQGTMDRWLTRPLSPDTVNTAEWLDTRLDIVSSPTSIARRCYDGDIVACKKSLRLVDAGDVVTDWFDAATRRRLVEWSRRRASTIDTDADLCIEGSDAACIATMRRRPPGGDPIPAFRRMSVAKTALHMGGDRGYERFLIASGSPAERLAFTAGVPVDSVIAVWLRTVREARRPSRDMSPGIAFSSIGWILVCGVLALRSTRWR